MRQTALFGKAPQERPPGVLPQHKGMPTTDHAGGQRLVVGRVLQKPVDMDPGLVPKRIEADHRLVLRDEQARQAK